MSSLIVESLAAVTASAAMVLMVAAGGAVIASVPSEPATLIEATGADSSDPLSLCRNTGEVVICIREES